jgi:predicted nuclease with TOPRIM domain
MVMDLQFFGSLKIRGNDMEHGAELVRLEEFVDKLLNKYNQLKTEYHTIQETLQQRDAECAELKNRVVELSAERTEVGNKVAGLIGRIEQWENEHIAATSDSPEVDKGGQGTSFPDNAEGRSF